MNIKNISRPHSEYKVTWKQGRDRNSQVYEVRFAREENAIAMAEALVYANDAKSIDVWWFSTAYGTHLIASTNIYRTEGGLKRFPKISKWDLERLAEESGYKLVENNENHEN